MNSDAMTKRSTKPLTRSQLVDWRNKKYTQQCRSRNISHNYTLCSKKVDHQTHGG